MAAAHGFQDTDRFGVTWQGRVVVVVGLGKSGLAAAKLLHRAGARVRITEQSDRESVRILADELRGLGIEQVELGTHRPSIVEGCEAVVVSPGVPETADPIQWAQTRGIPVMGEMELAFRFCKAPIVAVTGTNGKSSSVTLIQRILSAAGRRAVACGNLGRPFCDAIPTLTTETIAVVEVSSFQLLGCDEFRPHIGVLLNLGINHLDRHQDRASYVAAKRRLFQRQTPQDAAVLNGCDPGVVALSRSLAARRIWFGVNDPTEDQSRGRRSNPSRFHLNPTVCRTVPLNAQAVLQVSRLLQVPDPLVYQVLREFRGLEHRLEYVATIRGVRMMNDAKSTTPDSLLYALEHCPGGIVPIIGGRDKGLDFQPLKAALTQAHIRGVVLIGESRQRLHQLLTGFIPTDQCDTLASALKAAMALARPGDTVLFSPACASFDMFRNFEERGTAFKRLVSQWDCQHNGHASASANGFATRVVP